MVALVNEGQEEGIYSYKKLSPLEDAQTTFESYTSSYEYWTDEIDKAESQSEINDDSQKRYEVMIFASYFCFSLIFHYLRYSINSSQRVMVSSADLS